MSWTAFIRQVKFSHWDKDEYLVHVLKPSPSISENKTQEKCNLCLSLESPDNFQCKSWKWLSRLHIDGGANRVRGGGGVRDTRENPEESHLTRREWGCKKGNSGRMNERTNKRMNEWMNDDEGSDMLEGDRSSWISKLSKEPKGTGNSKPKTKERNWERKAREAKKLESKAW